MRNELAGNATATPSTDEKLKQFQFYTSSVNWLQPAEPHTVW